MHTPSSRIKRLPLHEAQKIAAGEVVERPASVVKELLENALDAGATSIELRLHDAGCTKIRIIDNGYGMSPEDARICTQQYTTSKISSVDELSSITTFGFRGEALASIAAVSRCTIITKEAQAREGTRISYAHDGHQEEESVAACTGTDITIDDLFYNVPARKKFLKKPETEWRQILHFMHAFCLNHPEIHFTLYHDDALIFSCPATTRIQRIAQLFDTDTAQQMLSFTRAHQVKDIALQGLISNHQMSTFDRNGIFLFVNKRWVKNQSLSKALLKGYMNVLPPGRYPRAAIFIDVDPASVDVNIHPRKEEVLFLHAQTIEQLVQTAVRETLEAHLAKQLQRTIPKESSVYAAPSFTQPITMAQPFSMQPFDHEPHVNMSESISSIQVFGSMKTPAPTYAQSAATVPIEAVTQLPLIQPPLLHQIEFAIIGYYKNTYILIEQEDGLFMIDQHAAHERILYEQFSSRFETLAPNKLLFPLTINVPADHMPVLTQHVDLLAKHGIIMEPFGTNQMVVTATPVCLKNNGVDDIIRTVAHWLIVDALPSRDELHALIGKKLHTMMACKAAVKAGDELSMEHRYQLLKDLHATPNRFTCPHGRPTCWLLHHYEIEKKFKRR